MANQNYQQTEMDLRTNLQQDVDCRVASVIDDTYDMLKDYNPPAVRNRHEAYGIAADNFTRISAKVKSVRNDMDTLLSTLANPNYPAGSRGGQFPAQPGQRADLLVDCHGSRDEAHHERPLRGRAQRRHPHPAGAGCSRK